MYSQNCLVDQLLEIYRMAPWNLVEVYERKWVERKEPLLESLCCGCSAPNRHEFTNPHDRDRCASCMLVGGWVNAGLLLLQLGIIVGRCNVIE